MTDLERFRAFFAAEGVPVDSERNGPDGFEIAIGDTSFDFDPETGAFLGITHDGQFCFTPKVPIKPDPEVR